MVLNVEGVELHIGPVMVLGFSYFRFKSWDGFKLFYSPFEARGMCYRKVVIRVYTAVY